MTYYARAWHAVSLNDHAAHASILPHTTASIIWLLIFLQTQLKVCPVLQSNGQPPPQGLTPHSPRLAFDHLPPHLIGLPRPGVRTQGAPSQGRKASASTLGTLCWGQRSATPLPKVGAWFNFPTTERLTALKYCLKGWQGIFLKTFHYKTFSFAQSTHKLEQKGGRERGVRTPITCLSKNNLQTKETERVGSLHYTQVHRQAQLRRAPSVNPAKPSLLRLHFKALKEKWFFHVTALLGHRAQLKDGWSGEQAQRFVQKGFIYQSSK